MAQGQSPENPVHVVSVVLLSQGRQRMLTGARLETANEGRHLWGFSSITRVVTRGRFALLAGGNTPALTEPADVWLEDVAPPFRIGKGKHGENDDISAVEETLGKIGIFGELVDGSITGTGRAVFRSLNLVPDKDTHQSLWNDMLHYDVELDETSNLGKIPPSSTAYNPIKWVPADKVPEAYVRGNPGVLATKHWTGNSSAWGHA